MRVIQRLRRLVESAPPDATVPVRWIGEVLDGDEANVEPAIRANGSDPVLPDLSVDDLMSATSRERPTVIGWIHDGYFPGAYKLNGREWRVPRSDWKAFLNRERQGHDRDPTPSGGQDVDLGRWRKQFARERAGG